MSPPMAKLMLPIGLPALFAANELPTTSAETTAMSEAARRSASLERGRSFRRWNVLWDDDMAWYLSRLDRDGRRATGSRVASPRRLGFGELGWFRTFALRVAPGHHLPLIVGTF